MREVFARLQHKEEVQKKLLIPKGGVNGHIIK